jgi:cation transport ATPase
LFLKSLKTDHIVKQNLCIALGGMLGTATAVLSGSCPLWLAVILHEGSTVLVVFNSLRNLTS